MVQALVAACDVFVHHGRVESKSVLRQPRDSNSFDVLFAVETMSCQLFLEDRKETQIAGGQIQTLHRNFAARTESALLCVMAN
jgi:hypothetical protein